MGNEELGPPHADRRGFRSALLFCTRVWFCVCICLFYTSPEILSQQHLLWFLCIVDHWAQNAEQGCRRWLTNLICTSVSVLCYVTYSIHSSYSDFDVVNYLFAQRPAGRMRKTKWGKHVRFCHFCRRRNLFCLFVFAFWSVYKLTSTRSSCIRWGGFMFPNPPNCACACVCMCEREGEIFLGRLQKLNCLTEADTKLLIQAHQWINAIKTTPDWGRSLIQSNLWANSLFQPLLPPPPGNCYVMSSDLSSSFPDEPQLC